MARIQRPSKRRIVLAAIAAVLVGGYFVARAVAPALFTPKTVIAFLIADIVLAPPLLFFTLRARARRKEASETTDGTD